MSKCFKKRTVVVKYSTLCRRGTGYAHLSCIRQSEIYRDDRKWLPLWTNLACFFPGQHLSIFSSSYYLFTYFNCMQLVSCLTHFTHVIRVKVKISFQVTSWCVLYIMSRAIQWNSHYTRTRYRHEQAVWLASEIWDAVEWNSAECERVLHQGQNVRGKDVSGTARGTQRKSASVSWGGTST